MKILNVSIRGILGKPVQYDFEQKFNLIHSESNAMGKTTLIRLLLFGMGFSVPATEGLKKFENLAVHLEIENDHGQIISLDRHDRIIRIKEQNEKEIQKLLPEQEKDVLEIIFGIKEELVLRNILGVFYIDQEKGWTMFNRGKVIGNIPFNIESYVSGISDRAMFEKKFEIDSIAKEIKKYEDLESIINIKENTTNLPHVKNSTIDSNIVSEISRYEFLIEEDKHALKILKETMQNSQFAIDYIEKIGVHAIIDGKRIRISKENIENGTDNAKYLSAKIEYYKKKINSETLEMTRLKKKIEEENAALGVETLFENVRQELVQINIDRNVVRRAINDLKKRKTEARKEYDEMLAKDNEVLEEIHNNLYAYAHELGVSRYIPKDDPKFVLTSKLKGFSGKILAQLAFSFRLAYIKAIEEKYPIRVPIIIDSPRSTEMSSNAARAMTKILQRDFGDNQIIVASNYDDVIPEELSQHKIELKNGVLGTLS